MTPKEKAEELYLKHRAIISEIQFLTGFILMSQAKDLAKKSALIAVNLILSEFYSDEFYTEVKKEIEKL